MGTIIRPEITKNNGYYISKHRYYELKHFCLQYPEWKLARASISDLKWRSLDSAAFIRSNDISDPTEQIALAKLYYTERIELVEQCAKETDRTLNTYILKGVTEGLPYEKIRASIGIPCCKDVYYRLYRKFFWILSNKRQ